MTMSRAALEVDALVRAALVVLRARTARAAPGRSGSSSRGGGDVDAEQGGRAAGCSSGLAEQRQVGDAAAQQDVGGPQDPVVVALGQHDVAAVGDRAGR